MALSESMYISMYIYRSKFFSPLAFQRQKEICITEKLTKHKLVFIHCELSAGHPEKHTRVKQNKFNQTTTIRNKKKTADSK